jgi:hypothetical protein
MVAQNVAIEKLEKQEARISCSKNKKMMDSSTGSGFFRVFPVFRG